MTFPDPFASDDEMTAAKMNQVANALYDVQSVDITVYFATFFPDEVLVLNGNDIDITYDGSILETYGFQNASAVDDEWKHGAMLSADTYTLVVRVLKTDASGILKIYIDDVLVATFDLYEAFDSAEDVSQGSIVLTSGWHTIRGVVDSKNASSSDYDAKWMKMSIRGASL